jgi:hypothetical protein
MHRDRGAAGGRRRRRLVAASDLDEHRLAIDLAGRLALAEVASALGDLLDRMEGAA